jgi:NADH:ubiquinone oxidoreductase subunit E
MTIGEDIYERMKPSKVAEILEKYE